MICWSVHPAVASSQSLRTALVASRSSVRCSTRTPGTPGVGVSGTCYPSSVMRMLPVALVLGSLCGCGSGGPAADDHSDTERADAADTFTAIAPAIRITGSGCSARLVEDGDPSTLNVGSRAPIGACAQRSDDGAWEPVQATVSHENVDGAVEMAGREGFSAAAPDAVVLRGVAPGLVRITVRMGDLEGSAAIRIVAD